MTAARTNAPTLAWLLTALTCLLVGLAVGEYRLQAVAVPVVPPGDGVGTVALADPSPTPAPRRGSQETGASSPVLLFESDPVPLAAGPARLRVARLVVPPRVEVIAEPVPGPVVLLVESGVLAVPGDGVTAQELGLDAWQLPRLLHAGQTRVVSPGARYALRNDGPAPAMVLTVAIIPG
jgi:hypothetical protein